MYICSLKTFATKHKNISVENIFPIIYVFLALLVFYTVARKNPVGKTIHDLFIHFSYAIKAKKKKCRVQNIYIHNLLVEFVYFCEQILMVFVTHSNL